MRPSWRESYQRYRRLFLKFLAQYKEREDVKMFLEILLSLATISIFSILALKPTAITIAQLLKEIEAKKEIVTRMDEKIEKLTRAQELYDREISRIKLLQSSIPENPSPIALVRQLEGLSFKHGTAILSSSLSEVDLSANKKVQQQQIKGVQTTSQSTEGELPFSISITATYSPLFNYLSDIEKMRRPIKLNSLTINSAENEEELILVVGGKAPYLESVGVDLTK